MKAKRGKRRPSPAAMAQAAVGGFYGKIAAPPPAHVCGVCGKPAASVVRPGAPCIRCVKDEKAHRAGTVE